MGLMDSIEIEMPFGRENQKLPDPDLLLLYADLQDRHFWIDDGITLDSCILLIKYIRYLNRRESDDMTPITIHIASPGGELSTMFTVYHTIRNSKIPVHTINESGAHSAAFIIFLAGDIRSMNQDTTFIAHEGSGMTGGSFRENKVAMRQYEKDVQRMKELIVERTDFTLSELADQFDREQDFYINYEIAKEKGVITE